MKRSSLSKWAEFVEAQRRAWKKPGVSLAVFTDRDVLFLEGFGRRRKDKPAKVAPATPFCIGSTTKAFTAFSLALLADEGKLDWDAPVRDYMPEFALSDPDATRLMTARDLLTHRSGLPRHDNVWFGNEASRAGLMKRLRHLEPNKTFRQVFQYQNLMYMAAGYLVERIAGQTWEEFVRERIFRPLGMTASGFSFDGALTSPDRAYGHNIVDGKVCLQPWKPIDAVAPAGAITSTVEDMIPWVRQHMGRAENKKLPKLISAKTLKSLLTPVVTVPDSDKYEELFYASYALGWNLRAYRGRPLYTHGGLVNGFTTLVSFLPRERAGIVAMVNLSMSPLAQIISYNAYDRLLGLKPVDWSARFKHEKAEEKRERRKKDRERTENQVRRTSPTLPLEAYAGEYEHPGYGRLVVELKGRALRSAYNNVASRWTHFHYDMFVMSEVGYNESYLITCHLDEKGQVGGISIPYEENAAPILFKRIR